MPVARGARGITPHPLVRGTLETYYDKRRGWIARKWPRKRGRPTHPLIIEKVEAFKRAVRVVKFAVPEDRIAAEEMALNTSYTWKDLLMKSAFGTLYTWTLEDGSTWRGFLVAQKEIQALLEALSNTPGAMLVRGDAEWLALIPPTSPGKALTYVGSPQHVEWADPPQPTGGINIASEFLKYAPPKAADFTLLGTNSNNPTLIDQPNAGMFFNNGVNYAAGDNLRMAVIPVDRMVQKTYTVLTKGMLPNIRWNGYGICLWGNPKGAAGRRAITFGLHNNYISGLPYAPIMRVQEWTDQATPATIVREFPIAEPPIGMAVRLNATNYWFRCGESPSGVRGFHAPVNYNAFMEPTHFGLYGYTNVVDTGFQNPGVNQTITFWSVA